MNQKGEITLMSCFMIMALTGLVLLCSLELRKSFRLLEKRTHLYLCVKETKGEFHHFMKFMGRANWAIKNINRASLIMLFIPGLQKVAMDAQKAKKYIQYVQNGKIVSYLKTLKDLKGKRCPIDPRMLLTPFKVKRDEYGALVLREKEWTYYFLSKPYFLSLKISPEMWERIQPKLRYQTEEKAAKLSSLLSSL